jgi:hypothetical protein
MDTEKSVVSGPNSRGVTLWIYRVFLVIASVVALVIVLFFFWGLADGSISSFNLAMWFVALAVAVAVPIIGIQFAKHGHHFVAIVVLGVLALPGLVYGLFLLLVIGSGTSWN